MKILMLVSSLELGGAETHVCELSKALVKLGHKVSVASSGGRLCEELERGGVAHIKTDLCSHAPHKMFYSYLALKRLMKKEAFDIVHAHSRLAAFLGEKAARRISLPFLTTVHASFRVTPLTRRLSKWGYFASAVSEDLALYLCENYSVSADKVRIIPNGIDCVRFSPKQQRGAGIVFISRLEKDCSEGAYSLCRIAESLSDKFRGIAIRIVGGGDEYSALKDIAKKVNDRLGYPCVTLLGAKDDVYEVLSDADVFVGVSRCALEAMSCGIPIVLAGNEGYFGIVNENNLSFAAKSNFCGRGCPKIEDEKLFLDISLLLNMTVRDRDSLGVLLRRYVEENNGIESMARKTVELYEMALSEISFCGKDVCICGYYGYGNTGDDTLLECTLARARRAFGTKNISALTHSPKINAYRFGVRCVGRYAPFSLLATIKRARVVVFGGGTLFQDGTSLRSMLYYCFLAEMALLFKKKVELWGNGFCELRYGISRMWFSHILKRCSYIGVRDGMSYKIAEELVGKDGVVTLERDLAFGIPLCDCLPSFRSLKLSREYKRYAVFAPSGRGGEKSYRIFEKRAKEAKRKGVSCIFVAMYPREDSEYAKRLASCVGGSYSEGLCAKELIALLKGAEFALSARLHLLVFARIADIPFEAVGSDVKLRAFCEEFGKR